MEQAIEILTEMIIKEHFSKTEEQILKISKKDLMRFCVKLLKTVENNS